MKSPQETAVASLLSMATSTMPAHSIRKSTNKKVEWRNMVKVPHSSLSTASLTHSALLFPL